MRNGEEAARETTALTANVECNMQYNVLTTTAAHNCRSIEFVLVEFVCQIGQIDGSTATATVTIVRARRRRIHSVALDTAHHTMTAMATQPYQVRHSSGDFYAAAAALLSTPISTNLILIALHTQCNAIMYLL